MAAIVWISTKDGVATKAGLEAASYAVALAGGAPVTAVVAGAITGDAGLGAVGVGQILHRAEGGLDSGQWARLLQAGVEQAGAQWAVLAHDAAGRAVAPRLAVRLGAGLVSGVTGLPEAGQVRRNVFSGKAVADVKVNTPRAVYTLTPNAFGVRETGGAAAQVVPFAPEVGSAREVVTGFAPAGSAGQVPLPEAERVVSAGRGLRGPEHWGIVEDLAQALHATTACSRPVADIGWRPHHEHVGQTGVTIRPNLYIAAGISGAIQHLAGVNQSKVIVVINTDPEAPFFKAADYGIVGDAFEVLPKLTAAVKAMGV
jgi:electron transfer flavoprotein alpha subunit